MTQQLNDVGTATEFQDRRRGEPRVTCDRDVSLLPAIEGDDAHFIKARLTDCSQHGLGLISNEKLEPGQQVLVRVDVDRHPTMLMYTIRYCIPMQTDEFRVGARFSGFIASKFRGQLASVVTSLAASR